MTVTINGTTGITNDGGYTGDGVAFADTTPANTLVTTTGGLVGMGTASPSQKLHVVGNTLIPLTNSYYCYTTSYGMSTGTGLEVFCDTGDVIRFLTGGKAGTERARITSSGEWLVGTTSANGVGWTLGPSGAGQIRSSGTGSQDKIQFANSNGVVGAITTNGSSTSYFTSSDYRLKESIAPMVGALATVAALKPVTYKWKIDNSNGQGFIAHELQEVVPDCVIGEKDAVDADGTPRYQGIDTSFLVATLTAAIQEQQAIITALTARVAALEGTQP